MLIFDYFFFVFLFFIICEQVKNLTTLFSLGFFHLFSQSSHQEEKEGHAATRAAQQTAEDEDGGTDLPLADDEQGDNSRFKNTTKSLQKPKSKLMEEKCTFKKTLDQDYLMNLHLLWKGNDRGVRIF